MWREGHKPCRTSQCKQHHPPHPRPHRVVYPWFRSWTPPSRFVAVRIHYCNPATVQPYTHPPENVWRHLSHRKSIVLTWMYSLRLYLFPSSYKPRISWIFHIHPDYFRCTSGKLLGLCSPTQTNLKYPRALSCWHFLIRALKHHWNLELEF